jgi:hypothetical protein
MLLVRTALRKALQCLRMAYTASQLMGSASSSMNRCLKLRMLLIRPDLHNQQTRAVKTISVCLLGSWLRDAHIDVRRMPLSWWLRSARKYCARARRCKKAI